MANEIYDISLWGRGACNDIGWGIIYKPFSNCLSQLAQDYIARVELDGGVVESAECIDKALPDFEYSFLLEDGGFLLQEDGYKIIL